MLLSQNLFTNDLSWLCWVRACAKSVSKVALLMQVLKTFGINWKCLVFIQILHSVFKKWVVQGLGLAKVYQQHPPDMVITISSKKPTKWQKNAEKHAQTFWQRGSWLREKFQKHLWQMIADVIRYLHPNAKIFWPGWVHSNLATWKFCFN